MDSYNLYNREDYRIIGNGGLTEEQAAEGLGITVEEFRTLKYNKDGYIMYHDKMVRKEKEQRAHWDMPLPLRNEWDRVCMSIRGALCRT